MFKLSKKGQSSSVFNLLIAALVSLAILGLLLSVLGGLDIFSTGSNPTDTAVKLLNNAGQTNYSPYSDTVTLSKKYNTIPAKALSEKLTIGESIYIFNCTEDDLGNLGNGKTDLLQYKGSADKKYTATAICGDGIVPSESNIDDCTGTIEAGTYSCALYIRQYKG